MKTYVRFFAAFSLLTWAACGDSNTPPTQNDPDVGKTFTQKITAATGGTLETDSGNAALTVPGGALAEDTDLTVTVAAAETGTVASVYDFGPEGTTFSSAASLSIKYDGEVPAEKKVVLATFDGSAWTEVAGSAFANGVVTGPVTHFSKFSLILVAGAVIAVSECSDVATTFQACGGDPIGTWKFKDICFPDDVLGTNPMPTCTGAALTVELDWDGTYTVDATTVSISAYTSTMTTHIEVPKSCLSGQPCSELNDDDDTWTESGDICILDSTKTTPQPAMTLGYRVEGTDFITIDSTTNEETRIPFCVSGNTATFKTPVTSGSKNFDWYMVLEKN